MKAIIYLAGMGVLLCCCRSKEKVIYSESEYISQLPVIRTENNSTSPVASQAKPAQETVRAEKVTSTDDTPAMRYYIIVGSFRIEQNAIRLQGLLVRQGFLSSKIMRNSEGMYRVSIISGYDLPAMQSELSHIRNRYPQYSDAWLLEAK